jgi:hypothetical protein
MEIKKLNKLYYIKKNIKELEGELAELNNLGSAPLNDMPKGNEVGNPTQLFVMKKNRILENLTDEYVKYLTEYEKISDFINNIEDEEIKLIARLRFIKHKDWETIGQEVNADRTTPSKKMRNYLESLDK